MSCFDHDSQCYCSNRQNYVSVCLFFTSSKIEIVWSHFDRDSKCCVEADLRGLDHLILKEFILSIVFHTRPNTAEMTRLMCQLLHNMCYTPEFNSRRLWWLTLTRLSRQCLLHTPILVCVRLLLVTFRYGQRSPPHNSANRDLSKHYRF